MGAKEWFGEFVDMIALLVPVILVVDGRKFQDGNIRGFVRWWR